MIVPIPKSTAIIPVLLSFLTLLADVTNAYSIPMTITMTMNAKHTLYDVPVSNNGARVRIILYKKGITSEEVDIVSPMEIGGLKSESFQKLNPQGKMPCLTINHDIGVSDSSSIPESDTML